MIKNERKQRSLDWSATFDEDDAFDLEEIDITSSVRRPPQTGMRSISKSTVVNVLFVVFVSALFILIFVLFGKVSSLQQEANAMEHEIQYIERGEKSNDKNMPNFIKGKDTTGWANPQENDPPEMKPLLNFDTKKLKSEIYKSRQMLEEYYHKKDVLIQSIYLKPNDPRYQAGLDFISNKMARALLWGDKFVISAMGSSVTAAHDNCNYDSYERQLETLMLPLWKIAGVKFEVRNAGEGGGCGDSYNNQIWCIRNILGDDTDIAHYSWTYFEAGHPDAAEYHEMFIRWALMMKYAPVPQFFTTGGERGPDNCKAGLDNSGKLFNMYAKYGVNIVCLQTGISKHGYKGKKWAATGDGMHTTTRYGENLSEERKKSLGVVFRNWHPGPLGFQVVADAFGYYYMEAMLRAMEKISATEKKLWPQIWPKRPKLLSISELPKPTYCNPELCSLEEPPGCHNFEKPTYGRPQIRVIAADDDMNPYHSHAHKNDLGWTQWYDEPSELIPKAERDLPECAHLDFCGGLRGEGKHAGWLTFVLPRMTIGRILVCCPYGKQCGDNLLKSKVKFVFDDKEIPTKNLKVTFGKCLQVQDRFHSALSDVNGHLHLGIWINSTDTVSISHVIAV